MVSTEDTFLFSRPVVLSRSSVNDGNTGGRLLKLRIGFRYWVALDKILKNTEWETGSNG